MDSTSPFAVRIAGQPSADSGSFFKPLFTGGTLTLVENISVGRRWNLGFCGGRCDDGLHHRRYRDYHHRSAAGYGRAS
ncbi:MULTISPECIES: hypothetical protein [Halorussus]|uniref:hypothetical protein n=1 Tax=Halorussus TaxID=1070314 RepID=UPI0020A13B8D|nr:hypothetical protein [Halorussus vallis]USZ76182.1 hypothetical protein NGM07_02380 [Halorussus vallis]